MQHRPTRLRSLLDATRAALANPEDTSQVFRIAEMLSFGQPERMTRRIARDPVGARLLSQREDLLAVLSDRAQLEAMPEGSLARAYLAFLDREGITAEGLVMASIEGTSAEYHGLDDDVSWMRRRMRDSHDLWHTVTGYHGDLLGEASLLGFTFAQTGHPGIGFLAAIGALFGAPTRSHRMITDGFRRGRKATWLPVVDWVALLPRPLDEVRRELGVTEVPAYAEVREPPAWLRRNQSSVAQPAAN